ncbi:MAG: arginase family protein, partial [Sphingomonadaceae bacterium]|nr:arginase family protein [Sphingomonadaceae bacterium]
MSWKSIADLIVADEEAPVALLGAPMEAGSVTPGRCDLAPAALRKAMKRISTYDLVETLELDVAVHDAGDVAVQGLMPADGFAPLRDAVAARCARHDLTLVIGGNNAVTRPAAHGLGVPLTEVGLITIDAHFDMRDTDRGPLNGNPVRCLLEDGLPGTNICQIGLAPFANTRRMHEDALAAGIGVFDLEAVLNAGIEVAIDEALERLSHVEAILVDFDIDVIDRGQLPGAPGARPGGLPVWEFFRAARRLAEEERVRAVDLTEFDPSLDPNDLSALTAARWVAEILAGFSRRAFD